MFHVKHSVLHTALTGESLERLNQLLDTYQYSLSDYSERLLWWNSKLNLVSRGVSHETIKEHIRHSLLLHAFIEEGSEMRIVDTGTGGGLPGIPLAICFPENEFVLNDIVSKKILAVRQMVKSLGLTNIQTNSSSITEVSFLENDLLVTKHAFKINELISLLDKKNWTKILFLKGEKEIANELNGIKDPLEIKVTNLDKTIKADFYKGKAIVEVSRIA